MSHQNNANDYFNNKISVAPALKEVRQLLQSTELVETIKWGMPCYMINGKNVLGIGTFKSHIGLWFYNGMYLSDPENKLINAQKGKTKAMRQWRFPLDQAPDAELLSQYIEEAIQNQKAGLEYKPDKKPLVIPADLKSALSENQLTDIFHSLNLTRKREFAKYISSAKRTVTRQSRLEKILPLIKAGKGLHDKYRP